MKTTILSIDDIRKIISHVGLDTLMDEMIARLDTAFQTYDPAATITPTRDGFQYEKPQLGLVEWMPVMQAGKQVTIKVVGYHPKNPNSHHLPTILSTVSMYDTSSGHLIGMMDATFLTALRTGAASAVASRYMAHPKSKVVGLIGAGAQALTQLHALSRIFDIEHVLVFDTETAVSRTFSARASFINLEISPVPQEQLNYLVQQADILCTATSVDIGAGAVFADGNLKPWLHVNAVGADFPGKVEVPKSLLERSVVSPDFYEQAIIEGECQQLAKEQIGPSLVNIIQQANQHEQIRFSLSVFDSTGWALEDQLAMELMLDYAAQLNLGGQYQIESASTDPRNPYYFAMNGHSKTLANSVMKTAV